MLRLAVRLMQLLSIIKNKKICQNKKRLIKWKKIIPYSNKIGEFLDWLETEKSVYLYRYDEDEQVCAFPYNKEQILAEFFNIDLNKVESERRKLLSEIRSLL